MPEFLQMTGIGLAGFAIWVLYKLVANHMSHHTKVAAELSEAIHLLIDFLRHGK